MGSLFMIGVTKSRWFADSRDCASFHRTKCCLDFCRIPTTTDHYDWDRVGLHNLPSRFVAIHVRHGDIHGNNIRLLPLKKSDRRSAAADRVQYFYLRVSSQHTSQE